MEHAPRRLHHRNSASAPITTRWSLGQFPMTEAYTPHSPCDFRSFKPPNFRGEVCGAQKPLVLKVFPQLNNLKSQNFPRFESLSATEQFEKSKQFEFAYYKPRKLLKLYTQILNSDPPPRNVFVDRRPPISSRMCGFPQVLLTQAHTPQVILTKRCGQNRPDTRRSNPIGCAAPPGDIGLDGISSMQTDTGAHDLIKLMPSYP